MNVIIWKNFNGKTLSINKYFINIYFIFIAFFSSLVSGLMTVVISNDNIIQILMNDSEKILEFSETNERNPYLKNKLKAW